MGRRACACQSQLVGACTCLSKHSVGVGLRENGYGEWWGGRGGSDKRAEPSRTEELLRERTNTHTRAHTHTRTHTHCDTHTHTHAHTHTLRHTHNTHHITPHTHAHILRHTHIHHTTHTHTLSLSLSLSLCDMRAVRPEIVEKLLSLVRLQYNTIQYNTIQYNTTLFILSEITAYPTR